MTLLLRLLAFLRRDRVYYVRIEERSRAAAIVLAMAERWRLAGVPEFADEFIAAAERIRCGR